MATDALKNIRVHIEKAAQILGSNVISDEMLEELTGHEQRWSADPMVEISDPANPGQRKKKTFKVVRVWHRKSDPGNIWKGGLRYHQDVTLSQMEAHAIEMSMKSWIMQLPLGGAKGGIALNPRNYSQKDLASITKVFVDYAAKAGIMSPSCDVIGPDMGTNETVMDWIRDHYAENHADNLDCDGVVTGKSLMRGGIQGRKPATGQGLYYALKIFISEGAISIPRKPTVIIQGFGNVGSNFAHLAKENKITVIAAVDEFGGVYCPSGLDVEKLIGYQDSHPKKTISGCEILSTDYVKISPSEIWDIEADIALPAATEEAITVDVAAKLKVKVVEEGSNGPTLAEADDILNQRGITVIPDIYANAGGVTVSYFEWARNTRRSEPSNPVLKIPTNEEDEVNARMQDLFRINGKELIKLARQYNIPYREAGYALALMRFSRNAKARP